MKKYLLIVLLLWCGTVFSQIPDSYAYTLKDVCDAVYGSHGTGKNLKDCFTDSDASKFDATYGSKTMSPKTLKGFRHYGAVCTRPSYTYYTYDFYTVVNGVTVTAGNVCTIHSITGTCVSSQGQIKTTWTSGSDFCYAGTGTDCALIPDGFYILYYSGSTHSMVVVGGKLYYATC